MITKEVEKEQKRLSESVMTLAGNTESVIYYSMDDYICALKSFRGDEE